MPSLLRPIARPAAGPAVGGRAAAALRASAAASPCPPPAGVDLGAAYEQLRGQQAYLVSTQEAVEVTSLWGQQERAVLVFGRHMG